MEHTRYEHLLIFGLIAAAVWFTVIYFLPGMLMSVYKKAILVTGFGEGPVPINTLYTQPLAQFADPLHSPGSRLTVTGVNRDTIITLGWLDLSKGPLLLRVPDMDGRYYSVQLINPLKNIAFAYVGKRTSGTAAGEYAICGPDWEKNPPQGIPKITSPNKSLLLICRVLVFSGDDLPAAYNLSKQVQISQLADITGGRGG